MIKVIKIFTIIFTIFIPCLIIAAPMILAEQDKYLQAYYTQQDNAGIQVELKGRITLLGASYDTVSDVADKIQDRTTASARLYNNFNIEIYNVLYIINNNNLITARITVTSVLYTEAFGYIMTGKGYLSAVNIGDRVVQKTGEIGKNAFSLKAKGDFFQESGQTDKAISFYKKAIGTKDNPESHLALGYIYLKDDILEYAANEFKEAQKQHKRLYDNEDKYDLYKGIAEVRYKQAYYSRIPDDLRNKYIDEGIDNCLKALNIYPDSKEINYYLGVFYLKNSNPLDVKAKDQFLKVISLDDNNIDAYISLAELYNKHNNKEKAVLYAEHALKLDPANEKAKFILKKSR